MGCLTYSLFISHINIPLSSDNKSENKLENIVKTNLDPIHNLTGTWIYIDNTDPSKDWATFQATYAWCTGDGSAFQPYTIPQVLIVGPHHADLITIKNSDVHFSIIWCDLLNGGTGIYLDNVTNGEILYNDCSEGSDGIYLADSHNNTFYYNDFRYNDAGITTSYCSNNKIYSNNFLECNYGIEIADGFNNTIDKNIFSASETGIKLYRSSYINLTRNVLDDSLCPSISLVDSDHNYIAHNEISDCYGGVYLHDSGHNTIYNNTIHDMQAGWSSCGVYMEGDFNIILDNIIDTSNKSGIILESCSNFNVKGNIITNIIGFGIELLNSESGIVLENLLHDCGFDVDGDPSLMSNLNISDSNQVNSKPVYFYENITSLSNGDVENAGQIILYSCDLGDFSNLNLNHCTMGIGLYYCESTTISDSDFTFNSYCGIKVKLSNHTTITNVNASINGKGIAIEICDDISITESTLTENGFGIYGGKTADHYPMLLAGTKATIESNTISYNNYNGIYAIGGNDFLIKNNLIERNQDSGIYLSKGSNFNNISGNTIRHNTNMGILLDDNSSYNIISGNNLRYNTVVGIFLHDSSYNFISENTASYNGDYGIKLTYSANYNVLYKNTLTSNYDTTLSQDFYGTGIEIYMCGYNYVSENTIRDHTMHSIKIMKSYSINITKNSFYDAFCLDGATNLNISKNKFLGSITGKISIQMWRTSNCTFIENELKWTGFRIESYSDNNSFIGNILSDCGVAFLFGYSSYNQVINNSIYRASDCFKEYGDCVGNVFSGNYCEEGFFLPIEVIYVIVFGSIALIGVAVFLFLKKRKDNRKLNQ